MSVVHCVSASTKTRSKKSSSAVTRSSSRMTVAMREPRRGSDSLVTAASVAALKDGVHWACEARRTHATGMEGQHRRGCPRAGPDRCGHPGVRDPDLRSQLDALV